MGIITFNECKELADLMFSPNILNDCQSINNYGDPKVIWSYIILNFGDYVPLPRFQEESEFKLTSEISFVLNSYKYERLKCSMISYDCLNPYNIEHEQLIGFKQCNQITTPSGKTINSNLKTSYDSQEPKLNDKDEQSYEDYKVETSFSNNISENFLDENFNDLSQSTKRKEKFKGNIGNHPLSQLIEQERKTSNFRLWEVIAKDILDITCYKIFKSSQLD